MKCFADPDINFPVVSPSTLCNTCHLLLTLAALLSTNKTLTHFVDKDTLQQHFSVHERLYRHLYLHGYMCGGVCTLCGCLDHYMLCHLQLTAPLALVPGHSPRQWLLFVCNTELSINNGIILLACTPHCTRREDITHRINSHRIYIQWDHFIAEYKVVFLKGQINTK